jgi:NADPH-dependent glutamate synthase beta subunit-like oxidoreductase
VTVFEAMPVAGGMLRLGVPEYRLPTEIIEREVQDIVDLGVDLRLNHQVMTTWTTLFAAGLRRGADRGRRARRHAPADPRRQPGRRADQHPFPARRAAGVRRTGEAPPLGQRVLVLGGGNVAIDVARSAVRLGREVHLACLESREEMPAHAWEVEAGRGRGGVLHPWAHLRTASSTMATAGWAASSACG